VLDGVLDALDELAHVVGLDRDERRDAQLVAAELAVRLGVDDVVGAQARRHGRGIHAVVEVDRDDDLRAVGGVGDERVAYETDSAQS
jgi:predicted metal-dependent phosphotriesterase family hydrolase